MCDCLEKWSDQDDKPQIDAEDIESAIDSETRPERLKDLKEQIKKLEAVLKRRGHLSDTTESSERTQ